MILQVNKLRSKLIRIIISWFGERSILKEIMNDKTEFLLPGRYIICGKEQRMLYLKESKAVGFIDSNQRHLVRNGYRQNIIKLLSKKVAGEVFSIIIKKNTETIFHVSLLMRTKKNDIRIFDFSQMKIVNFVSDENNLRLRAESYQVFYKYFTIPQQAFDFTRLQYVEELIDFRPYSTWSISEKIRCIEIITEQYKAYITHCRTQNKCSLTLVEITKRFQNMCNIPRELMEKIISIFERQPEDMNNRFILIKSHGDLTINNVLLAGDKYFIIDWEDTGDYVFFYDFYNLLFMEKFLSNNDYFINLFVTENLNYLQNIIFNAAGLEYQAEWKTLYIIIYFLFGIEKQILHGEIPDKLIIDYLSKIVESYLT